jgi:hypothetical protein
MERQSKINQKEYRYYILASTIYGTKVVESGWEYKEDAHDQKNELAEDGIKSRIYSKSAIYKMGINVNDNKFWGNAYRQEENNSK